MTRTLLLAGLLTSTAAQAQTVAAANDAPVDIIVTAQRREQSLQSVGVAVTAITPQALTERGAVTVNDLQYLAPSLRIEPAFGGGAPQFRLRGVGFEDYASNNAPAVGVSVDEVPQPVPVTTQGLLFDLARAEVLRGPQGTLYGRNTTGGAINLYSAPATDTLHAGVTAEYARFNEGRVEAYISGPLADGVRARLSAATDQGGAWQVNRYDGRTLGNADRTAVRARLEFGDLDHDHLRLIGSYGHDGSDGLGLYLIQPAPALGADPAQPADRSRRLTGWGLSPSFAQLLGLSTRQRPFRDNDMVTLSANAGLDIGALGQLTSITGYQSLHRRELNDWASLPGGNSDVFFQSKVKVFTQEVRLTGTTGKLRYTAGTFYDNETLHETYRSDFVDGGFDGNAYTPYRQRVESISGFGQLEYQATPRLNLIAGGRYEFETRRLIDLTTSLNVSVFPNIFKAPLGTVIPFVPPQNRRVTLDDWSGKLGAEYRLTDAVLLYATASKGVKSGGFTALNTLTAPAVDPFRPETLYAFEVGQKARFLDNRLTLNLAAFDYDYRNEQVQGLTTALVGGNRAVVGRIINAPRSEIYGVEAEGSWHPAPWLTLGQTFSYNKGEYRRFADIGVQADGVTTFVINRRGQDLGIPRILYGGSVEGSIPAGGFELTPRLEYNFRDKSTLAVLRAAGSAFTVPSYWLVDASVTLTRPQAPWSVALFGRNILDQGYDLARNFFIGGFDVAAPGHPATYGVRLSAKY